MPENFPKCVMRAHMEFLNVAYEIHSIHHFVHNRIKNEIHCKQEVVGRGIAAKVFQWRVT